MVDKAAVAELLAYDISPTQIGQAFGVSSQYIQNLMKDDEELKDILKEKAAEVAVREHNSRVNIEIVKDKMLTKLVAQVDMSDSLMETARALQTVVDIEAKQRALSHGLGAEPKGNSGTLDLNLNLPEGATVQIQKNGTNEIISIAGRDMAPMPAKQVLEAVKENKERKNGEAGTESNPGQRGNEHEASYSREYSTDSL